MRHRLAIFAVAAFLLPIAVTASAGTITVDEWTIGVAVDTPDDWIFDATVDISDPFVEILTAAAPPAFSASAAHAFSWSDSVASFQIDAALQIPDLPSGRYGESFSSGSIYFTADEDLLLNLDAALHYELPPHRYWTDFFISIAVIEPWTSVFYYVKRVDSSDYVHKSGTITTSTDALLLDAGKQYRLSYTLSVSSAGDNTEVLATGDGHVQFTMSPVPEPTTALLLFAAAIPVITRRRSQSDVAVH